MSKMPITVDGYRRLEESIRHLKQDERPRIIAAIAEARSHGDLSENAEYHAAKEQQSFIESRIAKLQVLYQSAEIIKVEALSGNVVIFGATVMLTDEEDGTEVSYQIVGEFEADVSHGKISIVSPLGRGLIGKKVGDSVEIMTPGGGKHYEVLAVNFI